MTAQFELPFYYYETSDEDLEGIPELQYLEDLLIQFKAYAKKEKNRIKAHIEYVRSQNFIFSTLRKLKKRLLKHIKKNEIEKAGDILTTLKRTINEMHELKFGHKMSSNAKRVEIIDFLHTELLIWIKQFKKNDLYASIIDTVIMNIAMDQKHLKEHTKKKYLPSFLTDVPFKTPDDEDVIMTDDEDDDDDDETDIGETQEELPELHTQLS